MILSSWRALCAPLLLMSALAAHARELPADLGTRLADGHIRPAAQRFADASGALAEATQRYCDEPRSEPRSKAVHDAFGAVIDAWGALELLRFGPLADAGRYERIWFWPDPRGIAQRQLQAALTKRDAALLEPGALAGRSVALQGLPAFDYVLYADGASTQIAANEDAGRYRCGYAHAIALQLQRTGGEIVAGWASDAAFAREFTAPAESNAHYRTSTEVASETVKALSTALQYQLEVALLPALGADAAAARPQRAPLWRSGMTARAWRAGIDGWIGFLRAARFADALADNERWIERNLLEEGGRVSADFAAIDQPLTDAMQGPPGRDRLVHATLVLRSMKSTVDELLVAALGVNLGFNSLDGD